MPPKRRSETVDDHQAPDATRPAKRKPGRPRKNAAATIEDTADAAVDASPLLDEVLVTSLECHVCARTFASAKTLGKHVATHAATPKAVLPPRSRAAKEEAAEEDDEEKAPEPAAVVQRRVSATRHEAPDIATVPPKWRKQVTRFMAEGLCTMEHALTLDQVRQCRAEVYSMFNTTYNVINRLALHEELAKTGFTNFKMRNAGRFDMEIKKFDSESFSFLRADAPWLPLVRGILGPDCVLSNAGVMLSMPGSVTQPWHSDGDHLAKTQRPPHCLNVFLPLVHLTKDNGGTEMVPKSHFLGSYDTTDGAFTPLLPAGDALLFDFRLRHRGLANHSLRPRPLMYITYCIPTFKDTMNFSGRRYLTLPALPPVLSRANRLKRRASKQASEDGEDDGDDGDDGHQAAPAALEFPDEADEDGTFLIDYGEGDADDVRASPPPPPKSKKETLRDTVLMERRRHRELSLGAPRVNGVAIYVGSIIMALDDVNNIWYAARITFVDEETRQIVVHYSRWHTRFDFTCKWDSPRIKPCDVEVFVAADGQPIPGPGARTSKKARTSGSAGSTR